MSLLQVSNKGQLRLALKWAWGMPLIVEQTDLAISSAARPVVFGVRTLLLRVLSEIWCVVVAARCHRTVMTCAR